MDVYLYIHTYIYIYITDLTSHIQCGSVLPKKALIILCQTNLDPIWMAWSGFGQMHLVWKQTSVQSGQALAEHNQPTTTFPLSDSEAFFHLDSLGHIVQTQLGSDLVLADCVRFRPNDPVQIRSMPVCKNNLAHFWLMLLSQSRMDVNQIWLVY